MRLPLYNKSIYIDTPPILVLPTDMCFHVTLILQIFVTGRAMISDTRPKMNFTHVPLHVVRMLNTFPTNHADKTTITLLNLALHQVIQREVV